MARVNRELARKRAVTDYFQMASERPFYTQKEWDRKSAALLKTAVGRKFGIFKTREEKALEEFFRLARNEKRKTPEMNRSNFETHPRIANAGLNAYARNYISYGFGKKLEQVEDHGNFVRVLWRDNGKLKAEDHPVHAMNGRESAMMASELKRLFRPGEEVLTAKHLGLADQISLKQHIEKKYKLNWDKKLEAKLAKIASLHPHLATP